MSYDINVPLDTRAGENGALGGVVWCGMDSYEHERYVETDTSMTPQADFSLKPDDLMFVAMLTAWVLIVALVSYLLLGWAGAGAVVSAASLYAAAMIAVQSREVRRPRSH